MSIDEAQIRRLIAEGDLEAALRKIIQGTKVTLYQIIRKMSVDHYLADDILQEVYIKVFRHIPKFEWNSALTTWLYRITINETMGQIKKEARRKESGDVEVDKAEDASVDFENAMKHFDHAVSLLPERQRAVFVMKYYGESSFREMAEILDQSEGGLKANYHHAVQKIKAHLKSKEIISS